MSDGKPRGQSGKSDHAQGNQSQDVREQLWRMLEEKGYKRGARVPDQPKKK